MHQSFETFSTTNMSARQYYLLGEFVYNLKQDVFELMDKPGLSTNRNLLEAKDLLINISRLVLEGSEKYNDFYTMFEKACELYYVVREEQCPDDDDDSDDSDY